MIKKIENWIDETNLEFIAQAKSCACFEDDFKGYYAADFLHKASFVVLDDIPKPDFPELRQMGLGDFIDMPVKGITYKDTYFIREPFVQELRLHFHELVHVVQWNLLGVPNFINRYLLEIQQHGYHDAPLERMAYALDAYFAAGMRGIDVPLFLQAKI